jgi:hypothetical protein
MSHLLFVFVEGLMSHLCYCIYKGAHVAFVLFVFVGACVVLCYLYL